MSEESGVDESKRATLRRFAALGAATPLTRLSGDGDRASASADSDSDVPDAVLGYLAATPGAHFSKLRDDLKLGTGETQYHLRRLEERGAVEVARDGDYKRFFLAGRFSEFEKRALGYLRRDTARGMLVALLQDPDVTGAALAERLGVSRPTVSKYAAELESAGLLSRDGGYAVERPETLLMLVVRFADSFDTAAVELASVADSLVRYGHE
ncbi:MarR family transcriptional regulator [Salinirubellus salinus]|jgi:predicted transcriptional regulator|uniref:MarR family transcriptional regulator n=1 Tax=Salinirubellus salinus TaxID=1364945 RepID=A0A9E7R2U8_9EURY|nr:MarR family transcriptional regulator [Salinirubellus salinus]UWM54755.1 MarR family transcriptional regulator [Salinirubellus salinus]